MPQRKSSIPWKEHLRRWAVDDGLEAWVGALLILGMGLSFNFLGPRYMNLVIPAVWATLIGMGLWLLTARSFSKKQALGGTFVLTFAAAIFGGQYFTPLWSGIGLLLILSYYLLGPALRERSIRRKAKRFAKRANPDTMDTVEYDWLLRMAGPTKLRRFTVNQMLADPERARRFQPLIEELAEIDVETMSFAIHLLAAWDGDRPREILRRISNRYHGKMGQVAGQLLAALEGRASSWDSLLESGNEGETGSIPQAIARAESALETLSGQPKTTLSRRLLYLRQALEGEDEEQIATEARKLTELLDSLRF